MTDPRITKGLELLAAYENARQRHANYGDLMHGTRNAMEAAGDKLCQHLAEHAEFFLRTLPARVAELEEGLRPFTNIVPFNDLPDSMVYGLEGPVDALTFGHFRRAASLLEGRAGETACDGPYTPITVDGATAIPTPPEASDDLVERVAK